LKQIVQITKIQRSIEKVQADISNVSESIKKNLIDKDASDRKRKALSAAKSRISALKIAIERQTKLNDLESKSIEERKSTLNKLKITNIESTSKLDQMKIALDLQLKILKSQRLVIILS
jgi:hypothetical protein